MTAAEWAVCPACDEPAGVTYLRFVDPPSAQYFECETCGETWKVVLRGDLWSEKNSQPAVYDSAFQGSPRIHRPAPIGGPSVSE
jgi:hypothetical protein